jgi:scyllo-inositol 2-dehydrogenase (NADP+)
MHKEPLGIQGVQEFSIVFYVSNWGERLEWKFFKPEEAPKQELTLTPIVDSEGIPEYCNETLKWYEDSWDMPKILEDQYTAASKGYYDSLYKTLTEGAPVEVTLQQVRQQLKVLQECFSQNTLSRIM